MRSDAERLMTRVDKRMLATAGLFLACKAGAQTPGELDALLGNPLPAGVGWAGFLDYAFLVSTLLTLTLAAVLAAIVAYHPKHTAAADTLEELEAPKVYILYAVVGAIIGILVMEYGTVVGLVIFGIGGLIRFRTLLRSASLTGRVLFVTLVGLTCGLNLPHVAVLATAFVFVLIYLIEARATYRIDVQGLLPENIPASAAAYRKLLEQNGCRVIAERKNPVKQRFTLLVSGPQNAGRAELESIVEAGVAGPLKGAVDWQAD